MFLYAFLIFQFSFLSAKWTWISMEVLMTELCLHIKIYLGYFPGRLEYAKIGKTMRLTFSVPVPKVVEVTP